MNVLIAERDDHIARFIATAVRAEGLDPIVVSDGDEAFRALEADPALRMGIFGTSLPGIDGRALCRRVRAELDGDYRYLVVLAHRPRQVEVLEALSDGADGVLTRPVSPTDLQVQLATGVRLLSQAVSPVRSVMSALREGTRSLGGEVIVRSEGRVGRIFFHAGRVVWVQAPGRAFSLTSLLESDGSSDELRAVIEECRRQGTSLDEALLASGRVRGDLLGARLRAWMTEGLMQLLAEPAPEVLFLPVARRFAGQRSFALEELLPPGNDLGPSSVPRSLIPRGTPSRPPRHLSNASLAVLSTACHYQHLPCVGCAGDAASTLDAVMGLEGVVGAAMVSVHSGASIAQVGATPDLALVRSALQAASAVPEDDVVDEILVTSRKAFHVIRITPCSHGVLCLAARRPETMLGRLRLELDAIVANVKPSAEAR